MAGTDQRSSTLQVAVAFGSLASIRPVFAVKQRHRFPPFRGVFSLQALKLDACPLPLSSVRPGRGPDQRGTRQLALEDHVIFSVFLILGRNERYVVFEISIFGSGRACPPRLTIRALNCPSSRVISSHEGYSRSGVLTVKIPNARETIGPLAQKNPRWRNTSSQK